MAGKTDKLLDHIGWRIIAALQQDARMPFSTLGRRVGLSAPAVTDRVRRMEDAGIIAGYRVELDMANLGAPLLALIRVSAPEENCVPLGRLVEGLPHVLETHRVTGSEQHSNDQPSFHHVPGAGIIRKAGAHGSFVDGRRCNVARTATLRLESPVPT